MIRTVAILAALLATSSVSSAAVRAPQTNLRATTFNLNYAAPEAAKVHDITEVVTKLGGIIGWQEVHGSTHDLLDAIPRYTTWHPRFDKRAVPLPISWPTRAWTLIHSGVLRTQPASVTGPARYIVWVVLRRKATGQVLVRVNTHLVASAWGKWTPLRAGRRQQWEHHIKMLKDRVTSLHSAGYPVIVSGDFNRSNFKVLGDLVSYDNGLTEPTINRSHFDYVMHAIPDASLFATGFETNRDLTSDHDGVVVHYVLR